MVILSSQEYSVGGLWPKKVKDLGAFVEKRLTEKVLGAFTSTSWNSEIESQKSDSDSESVSTDILTGNPEDDGFGGGRFGEGDNSSDGSDGGAGPGSPHGF